MAAKKLHINVCHIEPGLRSGDERMPEEINRLVTDRLSNLLLTPDRLSSENLRKEGVPEEKIRFVGNIMIDTLEHNRDKAARLDINNIIKSNLIEGQAFQFSDYNKTKNKKQEKRNKSQETPNPTSKTQNQANTFTHNSQLTTHYSLLTISLTTQYS